MGAVMAADRIVFLIVLLGGSFAFGMDVGHWRAIDKLAATCPAQPGETLIASHQKADGTVMCEYGRAYGINTQKRKAT